MDLFESVMQGDIDRVKYLIENRADVHDKKNASLILVNCVTISFAVFE